MKPLLIFILVFSLISIFEIDSNAQNEKGNFLISATTAHFVKDNSDKLDTKGFYRYPIGLGFELLYQYRLNSKISLSTGLSYQNGKLATHKMNEERRFQFEEISLPLLLKGNIRTRSQNYLPFSIGIYTGKFLHINAESVSRSDEWHDIKISQLDGFEENTNNFFIDLYFDISHDRSIGQFGMLSFSPFIKYRIIGNWFNYYYQVTYGFKITYPFNIKHNETKNKNK